MKKKQKAAGILFLCVLLVLVFAPRGNILATDVTNIFAGCSREHLMGTDNLGRDVYSLILEGGLRTIEVVFLATGISFLLGTVLGMTAAFGGSLVSNAIQVIADFTLIIPSFIMALVFSAVFGFSPLMAGIVFGIGNMGEYENQAYQMAYSLKKMEFIDAERVVGLSTCKIIFFHVLPNLYRQLFVFLGNKASNVTIQYAGLAFIGLGADITNPDWGTMLYQYRSYITTYPRLIVFPSLAIAIITVFLHVMFDNGTADREEVTLYD